ARRRLVAILRAEQTRLTPVRVCVVLVLFRLTKGVFRRRSRRRSRKRHPRTGLATPRPGDPGLRAFGHYDPNAAAAPTAQAVDSNGLGARSRPEGGTMPSGWGESSLAGPAGRVMSRRQAAGSNARSAKAPQWEGTRRSKRQRCRGGAPRGERPWRKGAERLARGFRRIARARSAKVRRSAPAPLGASASLLTLAPFWRAAAER